METQGVVSHWIGWGCLSRLETQGIVSCRVYRDVEMETQGIVSHRIGWGCLSSLETQGIVSLCCCGV